MAIPSKVTTNNQVQDGFRKLNETIDNIVTGLTYSTSTNDLTLSKLNGDVLVTNVESYGFSDYQFYAGAFATQGIIFNYGGGSGYFWKRDSLLHIGQGNYNFYLPSSFTETKGYKLTLMRYTTTAGNVRVYISQNGINTEPNVLLFDFTVTSLNTTLVLNDTGSYVYFSSSLDTSKTIQKDI